ncbi:UNVERIFIED_CONTAM: hypothetical protein GTU68_028423, partial [Idotea baltica]|nr:hypothetical protein [Idotea baltica]
EPESLGAISLAGREKLDNLIFVINCNLQRLDGPVRGNGKIVQELEGGFRGAGWNVVKCLWGTGWDELLAQDSSGKLRQLMEECVDGEYQDFKSKDGAYIKQNFFGRYPETAAMVADWDDAKIWKLTRGGHDPRKVFAAYQAAVDHKGQPTLILAKTVKGYGMGTAGEAQNITHSAKKMDIDALQAFHDRFTLDLTRKQMENLELIKFKKDSPEDKYLHERREALGGYLPQRRVKTDVELEVPPLEKFGALLKTSGEREISTTMSFVRALNTLLRDKKVGKHIVPIVPDESRTFGMEGMFRQFGIFSQVGQLYKPEDADQLMYYKESQDGQMLQEERNLRAIGSCDFRRATAYSTGNVPMVSFWIHKTDVSWAADRRDLHGCSAIALRAALQIWGHRRAKRRFNGGRWLQHVREVWPQPLATRAIDPNNCSATTLPYQFSNFAVIIQDGMRAMVAGAGRRFLCTHRDERNYHHPDMQKVRRGHPQRHAYLLRKSKRKKVQNFSAHGFLVRSARVDGGGQMLKKISGVRVRRLERDQLLPNWPPDASRLRANQYATRLMNRSAHMMTECIQSQGD